MRYIKIDIAGMPLDALQKLLINLNSPINVNTCSYIIPSDMYIEVETVFQKPHLCPIAWFISPSSGWIKYISYEDIMEYIDLISLIESSFKDFLKGLGVFDSNET